MAINLYSDYGGFYNNYKVVDIPKVDLEAVSKQEEVKKIEENASMAMQVPALEKPEEDGCARDVQGLPVAEDHDGQGQEAEARHVAGGGAVGGGEGVDEAAHARQGAGDGGAGVAHLLDVDAQGVGGLGVLAAGP